MKCLNPYAQKTKTHENNNKEFILLMQKPSTFTQQTKRPVVASPTALKHIEILLEQSNLLYQICWNKLLWIPWSDIYMN